MSISTPGASPITTDELRKLIETERTVFHWGKEYAITPALVEKTFGDGKALMGIQPLNTRPNYYVIRVESQWKGEDEFAEHLDDVLEAIEDEYSYPARERAYHVECGRTPEEAEQAVCWPVLDMGAGVSWFDLGWPR